MTGALQGARVVNTRAVHQAADLDALLRDHGAVPLAYPCLSIVPPADTTAFDAALDDLIGGAFDWLMLTSANAVRSIAERLVATDRRWSDPPPFHTATVGRATAEEAALQLAITPAFIPAAEGGDELARSLPLDPGERVLMPRSEIARPEPAAILRERGAVVTDVVAYRTATGSGGVDLPRLLQRGEVDAITLTSPSAVDGLSARLASEGGDPLELNGLIVATIGPTTDAAAKRTGLRATEMAETPSLPALIEALARGFAASRRSAHKGETTWLSRSSA